jgi:hypothetical protein
MGSFSIWHWFMGGPLLILLLLVGGVLYFALRKPSATSSPPHSNTSAPIEQNSSLQRTTEQKIIAISYLVGGAIAVITTLPQLNGVAFGLMAAISWIILLAQIGAALYGGWQYWNNKPIGAQILYWLSWSCVPVLSCSILSYWCAIGLGLFPTLFIGFGSISADFNFRFGYVSELWFNTNYSGLSVGANLVALVFVRILRKSMKTSGIKSWPLLIKNR